MARWFGCGKFFQGGAAKLAQVGEISGGIRFRDVGKRPGFIVQEALAQVFQAMQMGNLGGGFAPRVQEQSGNGVGVFVAHKATDILHLAATGGMMANALVFPYGVPKFFGQRHALELFRGKAGESFAQGLQFEHCGFDAGF